MHGSYSDLFSVVKELKIDGKKIDYKGWEDFIEQLVPEHEGLDTFTRKLHARSIYSEIILTEGLALYFLQIISDMFKRIYFKRLS